MILRSFSGHGLHRGGLDPLLAGVGGVVRLREGLHVVVAIHHRNDVVDQVSRDLHVLGDFAAPSRDLLHLHDDLAPGVSHRRGDRERLERERLPLHGHVPVAIGRRAAQNSHVDRERLVREEGLAVELHPLHEVLPLGPRPPVHLATLVNRIDEGVEANVGNGPRLLGGDVAVEVRDHALWQVVGVPSLPRNHMLFSLLSLTFPNPHLLFVVTWLATDVPAQPEPHSRVVIHLCRGGADVFQL